MKQWPAAAAMIAFVFVLGCGGSDEPPAKTTAKRGKKTVDAEAQATRAAADESSKKKFQPVQLGDGGTDGSQAAASKKNVPDEKKAESVVAALQPFQILLGDWRWGTRKQFG